MHGVFDDGEEEIEPVQPRRDRELTLGPAMLLAIFFGFALICGLCFGLGYSVGRHSSSAASPPPAANTQSTLLADSSRPKPSATPQASAAPPASRAVVDLPPSTDSSVHSIAGPQSAEPASGPRSAIGQAQVRPALPPQQPAESRYAESASAPTGAPMVQIAAVSHPEDADVLVNALRKRGYAVSARREATDNLIHVRIGPFGSRDEANRWRQKLLGDGYNAIVQP
ncbi:MAG: SPOR domain-containing protein [Terracidiphilus sp.]|jgi:cell division septation protein DedD